jgi:GAF domain-containing protein
MSVISARSPDDVRMVNAQRSLTVSAKLALCLQPEFDQVSIVVVGPAGDVATWAHDGDVVGALDRLQDELGEGPCLDSISTARCVLAPHLQQDDRWPAYAREAGRLGLRSQLSAPLRGDDGAMLGALNLYSTTDARLALTSPLVAEVIAAQVASALDDLWEIERLTHALEDDATLGLATGVAMARLDVDADHAAAHLRRTAMLRNQRLAQVAEDLVSTRQLPSVPPA